MFVVSEGSFTRSKSTAPFWNSGSQALDGSSAGGQCTGRVILPPSCRRCRWHGHGRGQTVGGVIIVNWLGRIQIEATQLAMDDVVRFSERDQTESDSLCGDATELPCKHHQSGRTADTSDFVAPSHYLIVADAERGLRVACLARMAERVDVVEHLCDTRAA